MIRTQIYLPENQTEKLKELAYKQHISVSEVVRRTIDEKIIKTKPSVKQKKTIKKYKNAGEWLLSMARDAERRGFKGPKDLASNVDKYLYGGKQ
ncbi:hypothetical protein A3A46_02205 [Candidatus Roizmanbacteria bacterium RIFCSPLOWO2_01_FULL_37_13]|uniref:Ribbon-helix-helix protein CopG domain-containing protein n=1 Tax=Candidatus Roizmanbacteria bacterium RIFCSPHIGHO2_02_FULL_38_11 TaxID=1802039 RepID=A0A1F7GXR9_9BACT|nr:MAG: hypothetical protein A3C25_00820 [Candidatus Roizmanbacteria bacterium RIFCSPHIGHO2_02_FULL_38_11]OGK33476.1 MAG: hypothetical protein A3F58_00775 [Candidatus Roizmanbacteria bacterium RIFCSPHIGHO2_12_FULL_37_9b]OGK42897.1 MAG: hypothetical protein A3A46_02205 [Candidatus Roizmanbacteria bacterium RIFCSPLOWO2_01_FULL_37_13]